MLKRSDFIREELDSQPQDAGSFSAPVEIGNVKKIEDLPDGSSVYEINDSDEEEKEEKKEREFYENIAEDIDSSTLGRIAGDLLEGIEEDQKSRSQWEKAFNLGLKYLGFKVEEFRDVPFMRACSAFDSTLSSALIRFWSTAKAELFPKDGPVEYDILGKKSQELEEKGDNIKKFMNYYLTVVDKEYYKDSERMLMYLGIVGCAFRKVYIDPISKRPIARFIDPQDFIVDNNCVSILSSGRLTHRMHLTKKEIILRQLSGDFIDCDLPVSGNGYEDESETTKTVKNIEGIDLHNVDNRSLYQFYEVHSDLDLDGIENQDMDAVKNGMPLPYIVTICSQTRKVVSIRRNWIKDDPEYKRKEYFVHYTYLPGFGIYGIGLAQLLGSNSIVLTSILRQITDAIALANFPGGLKTKGLRIETNDKAIGPTEFWDVDTGGAPIESVIKTFGSLFNNASSAQALREIRNDIKQESELLGSIAESKISELNSNVPVGTTIALLEVHNLVQSSVLRTIHDNLSDEFQLLFDLFSKNFENDPYPFSVPGYEGIITRGDFDIKIKIIPVSDPNVTTSTQRILRSEALLKIAQSAPELHDMRNAYYRMYVAMKVENIDEILPPEKETLPLDPISENMNAMQGQPVKAAIWQDHQAHIAVHSQYSEEFPSLVAHIQEHRAYQYGLEMQAQMGKELPGLDDLMNPEIQNAVAMQAAQISMQISKELKEQQPQPIDPAQLMLIDIEAKKEMARIKEESDKLRAEVESMKAQLNFEAEKIKLEAQLKMAEEKNAVDIEIAHMRENKHETIQGS